MNKILVIGAMLAVPSVALAQGQTAPVAPAAPAAPVEATPPASGGQPSDYPTPAIMPRILPAWGQPPAAPAADKGDVTGYSGGDYMVTDTNPALYGGVKMSRKIPKHHVVKQGDTLWKLCDHYYGDPWAWPQLWAFNKSITNPHWIYPGDRLRLLGGGEFASQRRYKEEKLTVLTKSKRFDNRTVELKQLAFLAEREKQKAGSILGANVEKQLLSRYDEIYVEGNKDFKPKAGMLYTLYRLERKLKSHEGKDVGWMVRILGTARIKRVPKEQAATAIILDSYSPIERKDLMGPLRRIYKPMPARPADRDVDAHVIANLQDIKMMGSNVVVFIDRGSEQGVKAGNRFLVVRRGDAFRTMMQEEIPKKELKRYPDETVAEVSVLDVRKKACLGVVTRAKREVRDGDMVRLRKGY